MTDKNMTDKNLTLQNPQDNSTIKLKIREATSGHSTIDIDALGKNTGKFAFDPGFVYTASCESKITYIDGSQGKLNYRGYPIEELAESSNYLEIAYLLYFGELPTQAQITAFDKEIKKHTAIDIQAITAVFQSFPANAHPMPMLMACMSFLAAEHHKKKDVYAKEYQDFCMYELIAKMPLFIAWAYRHGKQKSYTPPDTEKTYTENFLHIMFGDEKDIPPAFVRAIDLIFLLHADHEQNASTSTVRMVGSTEASPFAALAAGMASLWGPSHGGANEAVICMLEEIVQSGGSVESYIERAKDKQDPFRLMGFGHRIYKNYDPRAKIIQRICKAVLADLAEDNPNQPLLSTAMELEKIALNDSYFITRKLYPNVDFYSGIILNAIGLSAKMFTTIFALARTSGWISHWKEMMSEGHVVKIYRPQQLYTGPQIRHYVPIDQR